MTAEQFWPEWAKERFPSVRDTSVIRTMTLPFVFKFADAHAAAQLAEKEREIEQSRQFAAQLESNIQFLNERVAAADQRLREAQAHIAQEHQIAFHLESALTDLRERLRQREAELEQEREAHEQIAKCLLPLVGTADGSSVSCAQRAAVEIKNLRGERSTS